MTKDGGATWCGSRESSTMLVKRHDKPFDLPNKPCRHHTQAAHLSRWLILRWASDSRETWNSTADRWVFIFGDCRTSNFRALSITFPTKLAKRFSFLVPRFRRDLNFALLFDMICSLHTLHSQTLTSFLQSTTE